MALNSAVAQASVDLGMPLKWDYKTIALVALPGLLALAAFALYAPWGAIGAGLSIAGQALGELAKKILTGFSTFFDELLIPFIQSAH